MKTWTSILKSKADNRQAKMSDPPSQSSSTSSISSRKFNLCETSTSSIIVYKMRSTATFLTTQRDLCRDLDKDRKWRCSRKRIPRGTSRIDVLQGDLFNEPERTQYAKYPNQTCNLASIGLPSMVYWRRLLFGEFEDLYILSPENSAKTSPNESNSSDQPSPT